MLYFYKDIRSEKMKLRLVPFKVVKTYGYANSSDYQNLHDEFILGLVAEIRKEYGGLSSAMFYSGEVSNKTMDSVDDQCEQEVLDFLNTTKPFPLTDADWEL